jgi:hypothetical protein
VGAVFLVVAQVLPLPVLSAAPPFSVGPFTGQYYRYSSPTGWFVDQGKVTVGAAGYVTAWRGPIGLPGLPGIRTPREVELAVKAVGFYGADTGDYKAPGLTGAGVALELASGTNLALAWAYQTGQSFKVRDHHGVILTIGVDLDIGGSNGL